MNYFITVAATEKYHSDKEKHHNSCEKWIFLLVANDSSFIYDKQKNAGRQCDMREHFQVPN
jgi:hypothetical protein